MSALAHPTRAAKARQPGAGCQLPRRRNAIRRAPRNALLAGNRSLLVDSDELQQLDRRRPIIDRDDELVGAEPDYRLTLAIRHCDVEAREVD